MAKQMKRVEKRYVPQQESFRQLPGLRPQAEPQAAVATPAPNGDAERLRELAESLAIGNKALQDFFTMEKSFEETNRAEAKVRAKLGLPFDPNGRGLLDYGVAQGYEEGRGIVASQDAMRDLENYLQESQYGITEQTLGDPDSIRRFVDDAASKIFSKYMPADASQPYLEGIAPVLAQAKLEARIKGEAQWRAKEQQERLNNYNRFITNHMEQVTLPAIQEDIAAGRPISAKGIRATLTELTKIGRDRFNFDRDTAAVVGLENMQKLLVTKMTQATSREGTFAEIQDLEDISEAVLDAMGIPDADGIRLSDLKTPEVAQAVEALRATVDSFATKAYAMRSRNRELQVDRTVHEAMKMSLGGGTFAETQEFVKKQLGSGSIDGAAALQVLNAMNQAFDSGSVTQVSDTLVRDLMSKALSGNLTSSQLGQIALEQRLPRQVVREINSSISLYRDDQAYQRSLVSFANSQASYARSLSEHERAEAVRNRKKTQTALFGANGITGDEATFVDMILDMQFQDPEIPVEPADLEEGVLRAREGYRNYVNLREELKQDMTQRIGLEPTAEELRAITQQAELEARAKFFPPNSTAYLEAQASRNARYKAFKQRLKVPATNPTGAPGWNNLMNSR